MEKMNIISYTDCHIHAQRVNSRKDPHFPTEEISTILRGGGEGIYIGNSKIWDVQMGRFSSNFLHGELNMF